MALAKAADERVTIQAGFRPQKLLTKWLTIAFARAIFNHMVDSRHAPSAAGAAPRGANAGHLDAVFHALADPTRRAILADLEAGERSVTEIAAPHPMSLAAVSKHLKVLEAAGLIARARRGTFQLIRLDAAPMRAAERWLAHYARFWNERLDALQNLLEGTKEKGKEDQ